MMSVDEIIGGMNFLVRALFEVISREVKEGIEAAGRHAVRAKHTPLSNRTHHAHSAQLALSGPVQALPPA